MRGIQAHAIAGIGLYHFGGAPDLVSNSHQTKLGTAVGAGFRWRASGVRLLAEIRLESIAGVQLMPVSIGVTF